jgi:hypothetical protein
MTRNERIRECLAVGDATSVEIAEILKISRRSTAIGLWVLQRQLHVTQTGLVVPSDEEPATKALKLYTLTRFGRLFMKKRASRSSGSDKTRPEEPAVCARGVER